MTPLEYKKMFGGRKDYNGYPQAKKDRRKRNKKLWKWMELNYPKELEEFIRTHEGYCYI